jgi:hypothetical protein
MMNNIYFKASFNLSILWIFIYPLSTHLYSKPEYALSTSQNYSKVHTLTITDLLFIDHGVIPYDGYRWRDVAGNLYSESYRINYGYNLPSVQVQLSYDDTAPTFNGSLTGTNLKPNFTYQMKLVGLPGTDSNERIGFTGRWWQEEWDNTIQEWANGQNLNNKGNGYYPNPNDLNYITRRDIPDPSSPTGKRYRFTGYLPFDFFITDEIGNAAVQIEQNSCFHVFWNTQQNYYTNYDPEKDGPLKTVTFDPDPSQPGSAYSTDFGEATMTVFGEWERLPMGEVYLPVGEYSCQFILTEESFHGWPSGSYTGNWASAMGGDIQFTIVEDNPLAVQLYFFQAEIQDSSIFIKWSTESELNNAGFKIYKSESKEKNYNLLSSYKTNPNLIGEGNSNFKHDYSFRDQCIIRGQTYFYKLAVVDFSGVKTLYGPVSVTVPFTPNDFILEQNHPNPFNSTTKIKFHIPKSGFVTLKIYDSLGKELVILISERISAGIHEQDWTANNLTSGIYFIFMEYGHTIKIQKAVLIK